MVGYGPTAVAPESERDAFFSQIEALATTTPVMGFSVCLRDLNATLQPADPKVCFLWQQQLNQNNEFWADLSSGDMISFGTIFKKSRWSLITFLNQGNREDP